MTIEEIERTLPSGFHDASLKKLSIDYDKQEATLEISVDVGDPNSSREDLKEMNRTGVLTLFDLHFCVIEPPYTLSPYQKAEGLLIADSGPVKSVKLSIKLPQSLPKGIFVHYFFVRDWNAFIVVAAANARFEWSPAAS